LFCGAVPDPDADPAEIRGEKPGWWQRWIVRPLVRQLKQGTTPAKLSWTIASGITLGIFPVFGTRAWLCLAAGAAFKLNQPILHTFKGLMYPAHLALIIPFIQFGQRLFGRAALDLSVDSLKREAAAGWWEFFQEFGGIILRAATAWLVVAPFLLLALKWLLTPAIKRLAAKLRPAA
jgi:hypothetical protein